MGRERSSSLFTFQSEFCCTPLEKADFSCCNDFVELIKLDDDQQVSTTTFSNPEFEILYTLQALTIRIDLTRQSVADRQRGFIEKPPLFERPFYELYSSRIFYES